MEKTIIGSGVYMLDTIVVRDYPEWPRLRPFTERTVLEEVGGTCGNVMTILAWLGWKAMPQACLDDSPEGRKITSDLERYGCDLRYVANRPDGGTTLLRCTHKRAADGGHAVAFRAGSPGGSRFPRHRYLRVRDEAPAFLEGLDGHPGVYFFDEPAAGHRLIARTLRERGSLVYFEPSRVECGADLDAVGVSDIVKFSGENIPDTAFTDRFPGRLFIQTLGADGLRFRLRGGPWRRVHPADCRNVVDWEGAGDWTTAAFLTQLAATGKEFRELEEEDVSDALEAAQTVAAQSVCFLSSKGMIHAAGKAGGDSLALMNRKDIRSNFSLERVTFVKDLPAEGDTKDGVYSDGQFLLDMVDGVEDDFSQMHCILRSGSPLNLQDVYTWFGVFDGDGDRLERMLCLLVRDR